MELFPDGTHVRLRSRLQGTYLHADENGLSVSSSLHRASLNTAWAVHAVHLRYHGATYIRLLGAAYGRYLVASPENARGGHYLLQSRFSGEQDGVDALWEPVAAAGDAGGEVLLRHARYNAWHIGVAMQNPDNDLSKHWVVEAIPHRLQPPALPYTTLEQSCVSLMRTIVYVRADDHGMFDPTSWRSMRFWGLSVSHLRILLARLLDEAHFSDITLCAWAGYDGRLTPLVVNLPSNLDAMTIVVLTTVSPVASSLRHPNVGAPIR